MSIDTQSPGNTREPQGRSSTRGTRNTSGQFVSNNQRRLGANLGKQESNPPKSLCPCCGVELKNQQFHVDLDTNTCVFRDQTLKLSPICTEILWMLSRRWPQSVPTDSLIAGIYGATEPAKVDVVIRVYMCQLRKKLRPLGAAIQFVADRGYRLVLA